MIYNINGDKVLADTTAETFEGKKMVILGDSISDSTGYRETHTDKFWFEFIAEKLGVSWVSLAESGKGYYAAGIVNGQRGDRDIIRAQVPDIPEDVDVILIMAGANDAAVVNRPWAGSPPLGDVGDTDPDTSFCGVLYQTCNTILNQHPNAQLGIITPPPMAGTNSALLPPIADTIKAFCEHYSYACFELNKNSGMVVENDGQNTLMFTDGVHPNHYGNEVMAVVLEDWVRMLFRKSKIETGGGSV